MQTFKKKLVIVYNGKNKPNYIITKNCCEIKIGLRLEFFFEFPVSVLKVL